LARVCGGAAEQAGHGQAAAVFGADGYVWNSARATLEDWQSEALQVPLFVVLSKYLVIRGSPQSRDGDDELRALVGQLRDDVRLGRRLEDVQEVRPREVA
jgi:hypothetical protein